MNGFGGELDYLSFLILKKFLKKYLREEKMFGNIDEHVRDVRNDL
jgi:hypothetical protein